MRRIIFALSIALLFGCEPPLQIDEHPADPPGWDADLALPEAEDLNPDPHVLEISLTAKIITREFKPGVQTELWTYNGLLPGPMIRAKKNDRVIVHFKNELPEATTIHWHGLRIPAAMDGTEHVQSPVQPGSTFPYDFIVPDAGTFWYHPHVRSSHQVNDGLYGAFIVEDPDKPELGAELVVVLSDLLVDPDGTLGSPNAGGHLGDYFGREGNILLVNGRTKPTLRTRTGRAQRWRIINAARTRYYWFRLPGHRLFKVASDGGFIEAPQPVEDVFLTPGERVEVMVIPEPDAPETQTVQWLPYERGYATSLRPEEPLMNLEVSDLPPTEPPAPPPWLREIPPLVTSGAVQQRIELTEESVNGRIEMGVNGLPFGVGGHIHAHVGETHVWEIANTTEADHPFHLHGFFFQVLDVNGVKPDYREWRDMVNVPQKTTMRVAVQFDDRPGTWMFHCHILDHADLGMMGMIELMAPHP